MPKRESGSFLPSAKVAAAGAALYMTTIISYILENGYHIQLPNEVASAGTGLITVLVAYLIPEPKPVKQEK